MSCATVAEASGPPVFDCELSVTDDAVVIELRGEADVAVADRLRDTLAEALQREVATIAVDAAELTFCDCSTMRCLVEAADRASVAGTRFLVRRTSPQVRMVMALCELEGLLLVESDSRRE